MQPCSQMIMQTSAEKDLHVRLMKALYTAAGKCCYCPEVNTCSPCRLGQRPLVLLKGLINLCSQLTHQSRPCLRQQARRIITPMDCGYACVGSFQSWNVGHGSPTDIDKALPNQTVPVFVKMRALWLCELAAAKGSPGTAGCFWLMAFTLCTASANMHTCSAAGGHLHLQCMFKRRA